VLSVDKVQRPESEEAKPELLFARFDVLPSVFAVQEFVGRS
jgi:hypothetical protein